MINELTLKDIFRIILNRIWLIVLLPLFTVVAATVLVFFTIKPTYTATTSMYVLNKQNVDNVSVNYSDLQSSQLLTADYRELALSKRVLSAVAEEFELGAATMASAYQIKITSVNNTRVLQISTTSEDPVLAANLANAIGREFSVCVMEIMDVNNVSVVDVAVPPQEPSAPKKMQIIAISCFAALVLAVGIALLMEMLNTTIRTGDEIEKILGLTLLARIPKTEVELT